MRLLVIDDSPWNLSEYSLRGLAEHEVVTAASLSAVCNILKGDELSGHCEQFDVLLTDLFMPYEPNCLAAYDASMAEDGHDGKQIPVGAIFALVAANRGISVAICTDSDHHKDPLVEVMDLIEWEVQQPTSRSPNVRIVKVHARGVFAQDKGHNLHFDETNQHMVWTDYQRDGNEQYYKYFDLAGASVQVGKLHIVKDWSLVLKRLLQSAN